ncbi:MAG: hypothetical protein QNK35_15710 [Bacteroides sp.]|nr:hypothetical protein [Bacteroides sp.]
MSDSSPKSLSRKRRMLFKVFSIFLSLFLLILVELGLRAFSYGGSMKLFVEHKVENFEDYFIVNPFVGLKYFTHFKATEATNDIFLKDKPENSFRIFVLGSSTTYGFPYERNLMASRILHKRLQDTYPDKTIELVNTSITAINSVTLKDFTKQIVKYDADALLIYAGHNEFYGAYGVGSNESMIGSPFFRAIHFKLMNLRLYQLMHAAIYGKPGKKNNEAGDPDQKGTLMKRIVKDKEIVYDSEIYKKGVEQFRENLNDILSLANKHGVAVLMSDLISNVGDMPPFGDVGSEDQSAIFNYKEAQNALLAGDTVSAKTLFYAAKDLDPVRFRASEEINQIIYQLGKEKGATLLPAKESFANASPGGIIGNNLLTEHVHPNIDGQFLLADVFYNGFLKSKLIAESPNPLSVKPADYYRHNWGYTSLDSLIGEFKVRQLESYWPYTPLENEVRFRDAFKPEGSVETFAFSVITDPDASVESLHHNLGEYYDKNSDPIKAMEEYRALVYTNPYWPDYLNMTAKSLYDLKDLNAAEKYARESMKFTSSYFSSTMLGEIEFIKHDYKNALSLYESAYESPEYVSVGAESKVFLLTRLYYLYHFYNQQLLMQQTDADLKQLGYMQNIPIQDYPFEYSSYIPYNIEEKFEKAVDISAISIDSAQFYLERCLMINDCPVVNLYLGDILYQKQDLDALSFYQKAYVAYAWDPGYLSRLFYAYFVNVNKTKATETLNRLKNIDPSYSEIPRFETLLNALP